ncbi:hypothetical protein [Pseudarthrobacter chlorophenolicus]|uniref:hypothetical protein n=1 Tax=Pseudarthrobacter chlorophenolicus TaxID=85085 RepID=UPI0005F2AED8|nr:hypothetical protein [Pseudarthrobacter chlorophenolicus]
MKLIDLFHQDVPGLPGKADENPFFVEEAFEEAQILDVRVDALRLVIGVLFELRSGILPMYVGDESINCGALILRRATDLHWTSDLTAKEGNYAWPVYRVLTQLDGGRLELGLEMGVIEGMRLNLSALKAEFYAGVIPALANDVPDYPEHKNVTGLVAGWDMEFVPTLGWYVDATK